MHKLTQLERLDLGNNEFSELVRGAPFPQTPVAFCALGLAIGLERHEGIVATCSNRSSLLPLGKCLSNKRS